MAEHAINILLIEDNPGDARLILEMLGSIKHATMSLEHSNTLSGGLDNLKRRSFDAILLDIGLPDGTGIEAITEIKKLAPKTPVVMLTGLDDEETAVSALHLGVQDYLVKGQINSGFLTRSLRYAIERKRSEEELKESHRFVRSIADATPDIIYIFDIIEHNLVFVNAGLQRILGYTQKEIQSMGESVYADLIHPEDMSEIHESRKQIFSGFPNGVTEVEFRLKHANGSWRWLSSRSVTFSRAENGLPKQILGTAQDVTERKKMEKELENYYNYLEALVTERTRELERSNELLESVFSNIYVLIAYMDRNFNFIKVNRTYAEADEHNPDYYIGKNHFDLFPNDENKAIFSKVVLTGEPYFTYAKPFTYSNNPERGVTYWDWSLFPVKGAHGDVQGLLLSLINVTDKFLLQAESMRASQLASIGELAAGVAHEINNPVNGIINYAQILLNKLAAESREYGVAERIIKEGDRIAKIVSSLLSFSRKGGGEREPANIHGILQDTLSLTEAVMRKDGIRLILNLPEELPEICVDILQIQQVILNLISNARYALNEKYPSGDENKIFEISAEAVIIDNAPFLHLVFLDWGTGIPANLIDEVTAPFFTTKPRNKGTGLGLSISHGIISNHGGKFLVESIEGEFTKITIDLPLRK